MMESAISTVSFYFNLLRFGAGWQNVTNIGKEKGRND